eukprot:TRINITY_DN16382_c0_g1_i1.p1 TRINITY_DN16382_c0_g1~~TRINITY_DN16382_c0_g1_i1.p1  ORF type:complete len:318 (-),score=57.66 TRINITY_DN16382_c0_g1_i1:349-1302(-)
MELVSSVVEAIRSRSSSDAGSPGNMEYAPHVTKSVEFRGAACDWVKSLGSYAIAPALEKHCLFAIVSRTLPSHLEQFRAPFRFMDVDADDLISHRDLKLSLDKLLAGFDVDIVFKAMDLDGSNTINFFEFVTACLYSRLAPLDEWLAEEVFESLDDDQDGLLCAEDVVPFFRELPAGLPLRAKFNKEQWCSCICVRRAGSKGSVGRTKREVAPVSKAHPFRVLFEGCHAPHAQCLSNDRTDDIDLSCDWDHLSDSDMGVACPLESTAPQQAVGYQTSTPKDVAYSRRAVSNELMCGNHLAAASPWLSSPPYVPLSAH